MGRPGRLVDQGVADTTRALDAAREELAQIIGDAPSLDEAFARIVKWGPDGKTWHKLGDALFVSTVKADLAGQLMVKRDVGGGRFIFARGDGETFLDKPWAEAIAEFKARGVVKPTELQTLLGDYAQRAVVARQLLVENIQKEVRAQLEKVISEGHTYREFAKWIDEKKAPLGIADVDPSYLKMVFRTNIQSAYGAGRFRAITDPVVMAERPFVQYRTVGDARVRESHRILDRTTYRVDSDEWKRVAPPNSYNCRCSTVALTPEEAGKSDILDAPPKAYQPDPDFNSPPVAKLPPSAVAEAARGRSQVQVPERIAPTPTPTGLPEPAREIEKAEQRLERKQVAPVTPAHPPLPQKLEQAKEQLRRIGEGGGRTVFTDSAGNAVKYAKRDEAKKQNLSEAEVYAQPDRSPLLNRVIDYDPSGEWIRVEKLKPISAEEMARLLGAPPRSPSHWAAERMESMLSGVEPSEPEQKKFFRQLQELLNKYQHLDPRELRTEDQWGLAPDGTLRLLDFGR